MWYSNLYRRHLCDMHIDDWDDRFLSEFSPETYVEALKTARINNAMIYLQSHVGLCYYPTKLGVMHRALRGKEDMIKRTVDLCHENGIKVTGYYSLIHNTIEHDRHPDWKLLHENGESSRDRGPAAVEAHDLKRIRSARYGFCCPNNEEHVQFVYGQIDEMLDYFELEALFFDMPFWPHTCYCEHCKKKYRAENGVDLPKEKPMPGTAEYYLLAETLYRWMAEWVMKITNYVKARAPEMAVEHNFASSIAGNSLNGCGEGVNTASDYSGGDLYGGIRNHSFTCKFYKNITRNQPFEYMFSRAKPSLQTHTLTKTLDEMKSSCAVTMSHHGATLVIDAIDPIGTMDMRVFRRIGEAFDHQIPYEPYFRGEMAEDVGIYYGIRSRVDEDGNGRISTKGCVKISDMLIRSHIPFGVTGNFHRLDGYKAIFAPVLSPMEEKDNDRICDYVRNGGVLYLSGAKNKALVEELTGGRITEKRAEAYLYVAPKPAFESLFGGFNEKYPLALTSSYPVMELSDKDAVAATLTFPYTTREEIRFASIHSNPPGEPSDIPAVVVRRYGKGTVIWSALPLEFGEAEEYCDILRTLVLHYAEPYAPSFRSTAPGNVEITMFESEGEKLVNCTVLCDDARSYPVAPFSLAVKCETAPKAVTLLPEGKPVKFTYRNGYVTFRTRTLNIYDLYRIEV